MLAAKKEELIQALDKSLVEFDKSLGLPQCKDCGKGQMKLPTEFRFRTPDGKQIAYQVAKYEVFNADWCSVTEIPDLMDDKGQPVMQDVVEEKDGQQITKKVPVKGAQVSNFFCPECSKKRGLKTDQAKLQEQGS